MCLEISSVCAWTVSVAGTVRLKVRTGGGRGECEKGGRGGWGERGGRREGATANSKVTSISFSL